MMPAYDALMRQGQQGGGMKATPVHHILEEKTNPVTGEKAIRGSDWRERAQAHADKLRALAYDDTVPMHTRKQYEAQAQHLLDRISAEDIEHNQMQQEENTMMSGSAVQDFDREAGLAREKMPVPNQGLNPRAPAPSPYQGLMGQQVPSINPRGRRP